MLSHDQLLDFLSRLLWEHITNQTLRQQGNWTGEIRKSLVRMMIFFVLDRLCLVWWWGARPGSLQWWSEQCSVLSRPGTGAGYCGLLDMEWARVQLLSLRNNIHWRPCVLVWITIYCVDIHFISGNTDVYVMWTGCARGWVAGLGLSLCMGLIWAPPPLSSLSLSLSHCYVPVGPAQVHSSL